MDNISRADELQQLEARINALLPPRYVGCFSGLDGIGHQISFYCPTEFIRDEIVSGMADDSPNSNDIFSSLLPGRS